MKKTVRHAVWLGYAIYAVGLTAGLLYYRFPSNAMKAHLVSEAAAARPPMALSLKAVRLGWPPGIDLLDVRISLKETPERNLLQADALSITPALWSLAFDAPRYDVRARAYEGDIVGHVRLEKRAKDAPFSTSLEFKGLQVGRHSYVGSLLGQKVMGALSGGLRFAGQPDSLMEGEGEGTVVIIGGKVTLPQPIMGVGAMEFDRLSMTLSLKDRKISLAHVQLDGRTFKGTASGTITLTSSPSKSRLDVKGTLEPLGGLVDQMKGDAATLGLLRQGLKKLGRSFVIQGTLENPIFRFL